MYALIRDKDGTFYGSVVFAVLRKKPYRVPEEYCFIVFDKTKSKLIVKDTFSKNRADIIIVDTDESGWKMDEKGKNDVSGYISVIQAKLLLYDVKVNRRTLDRCIKADAEYVYKEYHDVVTEKDIDDFLSASDGLYYSVKSNPVYDNETDCLRVYFTDSGQGGFDVEILFTGNPQYAPGKYDPDKDYGCEFYECSLLLYDGYVYLVNDYNIKDPSQIDDVSCCFRAKRMKYRIIPK